MRLLVKLRALSDFKYDIEYYPKLQAFIYDLLRNTVYDFLHSQPKHKFFNFSNIFPVPTNNNMVIKEGSIRNFIVSSPDNDFIDALHNSLMSRLKQGMDKMVIGWMEYRIIGVKKIRTRIPRTPFKIVSATPIIFRIYKDRYKEFGIESGKEYVFWRPEYDVKTFMKLVNEDTINKYMIYHGIHPGIDHVFTHLRFKKTVAVEFNINSRRARFIGSIWEFPFTNVDRKEARILRFITDVGLGERNSMGFGFLNIMEAGV